MSGLGSIAFMYRTLSPYHVDRLNALQSRLPIGTSLLGVGVSDRTRLHAWRRMVPARFEEVTLFPGRQAENLGWAAVARASFNLLECRRPRTVFVSGYDTSFCWSAVTWCRLRSARCILMSDSTSEDRPRQPWKEVGKGLLLGAFDGAFVSGSRSMAYLRCLGWNRKPIADGVDVVDNDRVALGVAHGSRPHAGASNRPAYFLCVARLAKEKGHGVLLTAYERYAALAAREGREPRELRLVGDGPLRATIERWSRLLVNGTVVLKGYVAEPDIWGEFAGARALVLCSTSEPWGLVVNEGLAAGRLVLVSDACGCAPDIVAEGSGGRRFASGSPAAAAEALVWADRLHPEELEVECQKGRSLISKWGLDRFCESAVELTRLVWAR